MTARVTAHPLSEMIQLHKTALHSASILVRANTAVAESYGAIKKTVDESLIEMLWPQLIPPWCRGIYRLMGGAVGIWNTRWSDE